MQQIIFAIFLSISSFVSFFGQTTYPTKDSVYIFWREDLKLDIKDFKGPVQEKKTTGCFALWTTLDLPNNPANPPKIYLAPVFDCSMSYLVGNDTQQIDRQKIFIDICEIWARWARKKFSALPDSLKTANSISPVYSAIIKEMNEHRLRMYRRYSRDVFREQKLGAFLNWKDTLTKQLDETKQWSTNAEECYRFISNKPLLDDYSENTKVIPPMLGKGFEQVLFKDTWHAGFYQVSRRRKE